ncbi:MAG: flagellar basal body rod protein FlgC [Oscillospiraceae bacterium]
MSFLNSLDITGSALTAENYRMSLISQNLANSSTTKTENGGPYKRKQAVFEERSLSFSEVLNGEMNAQTKGGVRVSQVVESDAPFVPVYDPAHPHADENGYVMYPNVNSTEELTDLMAATRAYEANITALNAIKAIAAKALEIGK